MFEKQKLARAEKRLIRELADPRTYVGDVLSEAITKLTALQQEYRLLPIHRAQQIVKLCKAGNDYLRTGGAGSDDFVRKAVIAAVQEDNTAGTWNKLQQAHRAELATRKYAAMLANPKCTHSDLRVIIHEAPTDEANKAAERLLEEVMAGRCFKGRSRCREHDLREISLHGRDRAHRGRARVLLAADTEVLAI